MSTTIATLPPPTYHIPHKSENGDEPDVPEYAFSDLWQDKEEDITFGDAVDIINPLQHIPIVSTTYRLATNDDAGMGSRPLGGALFGGPLGILITGLTAIFEEVSGGAVEEHAASLRDTLTGEDNADSQIAATQEKVFLLLPLSKSKMILPRCLVRKSRGQKKQYGRLHRTIYPVSRKGFCLRK